MHDLELVLGIDLKTGEPVVLRGKEAARHQTIVGVTGAGKSKHLAGKFVQLLNQRVGCFLLDPHGDLCDDILAMLLDSGYFVSEQSFERLRYLDFTRNDAFVPFNVLSQPYSPYHIAASVLEAVKRSWSSLAGGSAPVLEGLVLYGSLVLAVNHQPLTKLPMLLTNPGYRAHLLTGVEDEVALEFFQRFAATGNRSTFLSESTLRRISLLTFQPALRLALGQLMNVLQMRELMDQGVSVLVNLGGLDPEIQSFIGCLITTAVEDAALSRADLPESKRTPYHFILDEFSQFGSRSAVGLERVLSLTRKYGLSLSLGCQVMAQIPSELRGALGQTTFIGFRLARADASWGAELVTSVDRTRIKYTATGTPAYMSATEQRGEWEDTLSSLPPRHAILKTESETIEFRTLGIPQLTTSHRLLQEIKEEYARRYLTPREQLETNQSKQLEQGERHHNRPRARRFAPLDEE